MATRRAAKRQAANAQARYDAAGTGRRLKGWTPPSSGAQGALQGLQNIRNRARDSSRNDWAGSSSTTKWTTSLVGIGITPTFENEEDAAAFAEWVPQADADGVLDYYGLETLAVRTWLDGGECFARRRPRELSLPLAAPVQIQLLESEFVPMLDADTWPGLPAGNTIRQGIERNRWGRRTAYWMYGEHPGDKPATASPNSRDLIRVPASEVRHMFEPKRTGQLRGVSDLAPILTRLRNSSNFEDAVLDRQLLANLFTMFITRPLPPNLEDMEFDPQTGLLKMYDQVGRTIAGLEPGVSQELLPGEKAEFSNPPEAGTTFSDYMRTTHLGTAAGQSLPYELMSGDIKDISDRTLRVVINEFRRFAEQRQWQIIIPMFCQPVIEWWAGARLLAGTLSMAGYKAASRPTHSPHGWAYIHPTQDIEGKVLAIENKLESASSVIAQRGDDPRKVAEKIKEDKKLGLVPDKPPAPAAAPKQSAQALRQAKELHDARIDLVRAQAEAEARQAERDAAAEARRVEDQRRADERAAAAEARRVEDQRRADERATAAEARMQALLVEFAQQWSQSESRMLAAFEAQQQTSAMLSSRIDDLQSVG